MKLENYRYGVWEFSFLNSSGEEAVSQRVGWLRVGEVRRLLLAPSEPSRLVFSSLTKSVADRFKNLKYVEHFILEHRTAFSARYSEGLTGELEVVEAAAAFFFFPPPPVSHRSNGGHKEQLTRGTNSAKTPTLRHS